MRSSNFFDNAELVADVFAIMKRLSCPCGCKCSCASRTTEINKGVIDNEPKPVLLTTNEVAKLFNVTPATVFRWCRETRRGKRDFVVPIKAGQRNLFEREKLDEYIKRAGDGKMKTIMQISPSDVWDHCRTCAGSAIQFFAFLHLLVNLRRTFLLPMTLLFTWKRT